MRIMVHVHLYNGAWTVSCVAEDLKTSISPRTRVRDLPTALKLLRYVGATEAAIDKALADMKRWSSHAGVWVDLIPGRKNLLRIDPRYLNPKA